MSTRDLSAKYGGGNSRSLINKAIRAELVGGDHALDALAALDQLKQKWIDRGWIEGLKEIDDALRATHQICYRMRCEIRRRYGMPQET